MGQSQFMPSTYLGYAVDADRDGRADIWASLPDVFASIANYLAEAGWRSGWLWGRPVRAPSGLAADEFGLERQRPLADWRELGVRRADGSPLPVAPIDASLLRPDAGGDAFLVYDNFRTIMIWNRSTYFALSVGLIADRLRHA
jgi:membrane-bound lytic murein transglycosylase B